MNVSATDMNNLVYKSQMVGASQNLRTDQRVKETDKPRETEKARDANPEVTEQDSLFVGSSGVAVRVPPQRQTRQDSRSAGRLDQGQTEWDEQTKQQGDEWLPPSLRPQSRTAGASSQYNVPYWLMDPKNDKAPNSDSPAASHRRLLNGLKNMVNTEIAQYVKSNEAPYAKKTLREIANVLNDDGTSPQAPASTLAGTDSGLNTTNWNRAHMTLDLLENPQEYPGEGMEMVA